MAASKFVPSSFFTLCTGDFATKLAIPRAFVEDHELRDGTQLLVHLKAQPAARLWAVAVREIEGVSYMAGGWSDFVRENNVVEMKCLVFDMICCATLCVSIFGHNSVLEPPFQPLSRSSFSPGAPSRQGGGERPRSSASLPFPSRSSSSKGGQSKRGGGRKCRFVRKLKEHHFYQARMDMPNEFSRATGMMKNETIKLEDWEGRKWPIRVAHRGKGEGNSIYSLSSGLNKFFNSNGLKPDTILLFELDSDYDDATKVMKVVAMEDEAGEELIASAHRGFISASKS